MSKFYNGELVDRARELRRPMTEQERKLWYCFLRTYPIKIYRQRVISSFIADFYCASAKLVIEIDGSQHYTEDGEAYDMERTAVLNEKNIAVIRFTNHDVSFHFDTVCEAIHNTIVERQNTIKQALL